MKGMSWRKKQELGPLGMALSGNGWEHTTPTELQAKENPREKVRKKKKLFWSQKKRWTPIFKEIQRIESLLAKRIDTEIKAKKRKNEHFLEENFRNEELGRPSYQTNFAPSGLGRHLGELCSPEIQSSSPSQSKMDEPSSQKDTEVTDNLVEIVPQGERTEEDHRGLTQELENIL